MQLRRFVPIIGILIFIYVLSTLNFNSIKNIFTTISPIHMFITFFCVIPIVLMTNIAWQVLLRKQKIQISYYESFTNILIGYFYGFITPGGFGGYLRTIYLQKKSNAPIQQCITNVILFNMIDYITLLIIGIIGALFLIVYSSSFYSLLLIFLILISIVILGIYFIIVHRLKVKKIVEWLFSTKFFNPFEQKIENFDLFYHNIPSKKGVIFPIFLSFIGWIVRFFIFYLVAFLFDVHIYFFYFMFIVAIGNIIGSLPITIYGLGTREITLISLFSIFSISKDIVVSMSLYWFLLIWIIPSLLGLIVVIKEDLPKNRKTSS